MKQLICKVLKVKDGKLYIKPYGGSRIFPVKTNKFFPADSIVKVSFSDEKIENMEQVTGEKYQFEIIEKVESDNEVMLRFKNEKFEFFKYFKKYDILLSKILKDNFVKTLIFSDLSILCDLDYYEGA